MKAGADQSQQRRHDEMGVEWVCEMGLAWWRRRGVFIWETATVDNLLEHGLGWVAWQINKEIAFQTAEEVKKFIEDWVKAPNILTLSGIASNSLATGSSPRFNVYGNDFGWGRPIAVRSGAGSKFDGKLTVFPGIEKGSMDFEACLSPEILEAMADDTEFMEALAS